MTNALINLEQQITQQRAVLDQTREELQHLEQLKRNFTMLAAHELRNPLAILLGYAKILEDESSGNVREYAHIVVARAQQLKSVVDSLIVLTQLAAYHNPDNQHLSAAIDKLASNHFTEE